MLKRTLMVSVATAALMAPMAGYAQTTTPGASDTKVEFIAKQQTGENLASDLMGVSVQDATGAELGDVNDLVVDANGDVKAAVIGVGGFLGVGEKNVAVSYDRLESKTVDNETVVVLNTTKAELEAAPDYLNLEDEPVSVSKRLSDDAKETYNDAKEKASETYEQAKEKASETYNKAKESVSGSDEKVKTQ